MSSRDTSGEYSNYGFLGSREGGNTFKGDEIGSIFLIPYFRISHIMRTPAFLPKQKNAR